jgi:hypothetical protein
MRIVKHQGIYNVYLTPKEVKWLDSAMLDSGIIEEAKDGTKIDVMKSKEFEKETDREFDEWQSSNMTDKQYNKILKTGTTLKAMRKWGKTVIPLLHQTDLVNLCHLHRKELLKLRGKKDE